MAHDANAHLDTSTATPGGELGGTWASPTVDATHSGSAHHTEDHDHDGTPTQKLLAANSHESPSADTHHAKVHGDAEHPVMGRMRVVRKTADETISLNTTSQDDDDLFFAIAANEVWTFTFYVIMNSGAVGDWKYQVAVPAGATGSGAFRFGNTGQAFGTDSPLIAGVAGGVDVLHVIGGVVVNSTTAGNVQLKWAQFATDAVNTTVRVNSWLIAHQIA